MARTESESLTEFGLELVHYSTPTECHSNNIGI